MRLLFSMTSDLLMLAWGCAAPGLVPAPELDLEAERESLMRADRGWSAAYSTSDSPPDVFVDMVADGAYLLPPGAPQAIGKAAIRSAIAGLEATPGFSIRWSPTFAQVGSSGDLGYTLGTYQMQLEGPDGELVQIDGKYITIWRKHADGAWLVDADMFNADGPPTPMAIEEN